MYNKNNFNSSNSKSSKDIKCNYYKKNSHKESDCFQKYSEKLEEYKAKQFDKKKEKKSEDKLKKSDSKDKFNTVNLNSTSLVTTNLVTVNPMAFSMFTHNQWIFDFNSYSMHSDLHPMETGNSFALIVSYILTFLVNIFGALRLLIQNDDAYVTSSGIFNKNNVKYNVVITSPASIYLRLASILTMLISTFPAHQTILSLDIIYQRLAYASLEVIKNTIKATLGIDAELVKKASNKDPFLCKAFYTSHITFTKSNLHLKELVVKAQDVKAIAKANSPYSPLSLPSTPQDAALPPQLNSMFEEVVQLTKEEEEVSEDKLP
ncbi:hypothetical protein B7463_g10156, partial [Scytalidium lignicola]